MLVFIINNRNIKSDKFTENSNASLSEVWLSESLSAISSFIISEKKEL